jgi:ABC-type phosphate/phosphonate transport system substrate-binding protein
VVVRKDIPADMRRDLLEFWTTLGKTHPQIAELAARGKTSGFVPVTHEMYKPVLDAAIEVRNTRKR